VAQARASGRAHTIALSSPSVTVPAGGEATVSVTLNVPAATAGRSNASGLSFREVAGLIQFTPQGSDNGGVALRVPYYLVPRVEANVSTSIGTLTRSNATTTATVTNKNGAIPGDADFYAWGISATQSSDQTNQTNDVRAVGVQSFQWDATTQLIVFAVNNYNRWSSPSVNEFDIYVDVDGDDKPDYVVVGFDQGFVTAGAFSGTMGSFVFSLHSDAASEVFLASAPSDSSTIELPILSSQLCVPGEPCLNAAHPRFTYQIVSSDVLNGGTKVVPATAKFNAWTSSISTGGFATVAPGTTDTSNIISVDLTEAAKTPALGLMVVTFDNQSGANEAQLIPVTVK